MFVPTIRATKLLVKRKILVDNNARNAYNGTKGVGMRYDVMHDLEELLHGHGRIFDPTPDLSDDEVRAIIHHWREQIERHAAKRSEKDDG